MAQILNTSGYHFANLSLEQIATYKSTLEASCIKGHIKGTILFGSEGVNIMLAGEEAALLEVEALFNTLFEAELPFKHSYSDTLPFNRLLMKVKSEIVTMGDPSIDPLTKPAPYVEPKTLEKWLDQEHDDEGRPVVVWDTRNRYEVRLGTFKGAKDFDIQHFRKFPLCVDELNPRDFDETTIVTVCTGGIRCEKGAPLVVARGFKHVYQLNGGILQYFKECGDKHWEGDCFVFDNRVALNPRGEETQTIQCFACRMPVTAEEQTSSHYSLGEHCPTCYESKSA